jgi:hypothetical protein
MQAASAQKNATKMGDQGFTGFLNIVDQATRMSWVNLLRVIGQPDDCLSAAIKMIRAVRQSYYNDPESDRWPVPKMLCVVDGGKEFSQTFRTGFAAELGPQVEVKWQTVPAGNPNAGASQVENSNKQASRDDPRGRKHAVRAADQISSFSLPAAVRRAKIGVRLRPGG